MDSEQSINLARLQQAISSETLSQFIFNSFKEYQIAKEESNEA